MTKARLTAKQEKFAKEVVLNGGDKVSAYKAAGYSTNGNNATVHKQADKLYNNPQINPRIAELQEAKDSVAEKQFNIDAGYVLRRLKEIDELDIIDIIEDDMSAFRPLKEWPKAWRKSISSFDMKKMISSSGQPIETIIEKIKLPDKVRNLEMIGRHVSVKAWDKEEPKTVVTNHIMPVPTADSADEWEEYAKSHQKELLSE
jgi:phage terminase small subunit